MMAVNYINSFAIVPYYEISQGLHNLRVRNPINRLIIPKLSQIVPGLGFDP